VKIHSDEIKVLVPAGHPLSGNTVITPEDLVPHPLLLPKTGTTRRRLNTWLVAVEDDLNVSMELDSTEMIKRFVTAGLGLSFLAGTHCTDEVTAGKLSAISLGPEPMVRQLALIYRKDKALSKAALGFIEATLKNAANDGIAGGTRPARVAKPVAAER
jgi:DNA-binding transcriptional LysR family regulator